MIAFVAIYACCNTNLTRMDANQEVNGKPNITRVLVSEVQSLDGSRSRIYFLEDGSFELEIQHVVPAQDNEGRHSG